MYGYTKSIKIFMRIHSLFLYGNLTNIENIDKPQSPVF